MKMYIFRVAILFTAIFLTNDLFAENSDSLARKEIGIEISGGSRVNLKGLYFTGNLYYARKRMQYDLQYNYYGYNYVRFKNINLNGHLEYTQDIAFLCGYKVPIHKFSILPMAGICFGNGRFKTTDEGTLNYGNGMPGINSTYDKRFFIGLVFNCGFNYQITNHICTGVKFTTFYNRIHNHDYPYYGLQLSAGYKIKEWQKSSPPVTTKHKSRWRIDLASGINIGKVAVKEFGSTIKSYKDDRALGAYYSKLSFAKIFNSDAAIKFTFQSKRIAYEHIYARGGPLHRNKTWYDLLSFNICGGIDHDFKRVSLYSYLGIGIEYMLKKAVLNTSMWGYLADPYYYNFKSDYHPADNRWTIPVSLSLGVDVKINRFILISMGSGCDYNLIRYYLADDGYSEYGFVGHSINQYSFYFCSGIKFNIQKREKRIE